MSWPVSFVSSDSLTTSSHSPSRGGSGAGASWRYNDDEGDVAPVENVEDFLPPSHMRPCQVYVQRRP